MTMATSTMARFAASLFAASLAISILGARVDTAFAQTAPRPPLPLTPHGKLAVKKEHRESATRKKNIGRVSRKKGNIGRVLEKSKDGLSVRSRLRSLSMMQTSEPT
jgi:hypothetical protein